MAEIPDDTVSYILKYSDDYNDIDELRTRLMELQKEDNNILEKILKTIRKAEEEEEERRRRSATGEGRWVGEEEGPTYPGDINHESFSELNRGVYTPAIILGGVGKRRKTKGKKTKGKKTKGRKTKRRKTKGRKTKGRKTKGRKTSR